MWSSVTHSRATVRSRRRSCHQPSGVQAHERGQSLRHPVSDHSHGAEHNADLQQGQRHLCAPFFLFKSFIIRAPAQHESATQCCPSKFAGAFEPRLGTEPTRTWPLIFSFSLNQLCCAVRMLAARRLLMAVRSARLLCSNNENCRDSAELLIGPLTTPTAQLIKYSWGSLAIRVFPCIIYIYSHI